MVQKKPETRPLKRKILIIEDNEQNLYLATFLLEKNGHEIIAAGTGPEGIELATQIEPDLILLDIQLPGMDGFEVLDHLRKDQSLGMVPIIAVTSHAMTGDRERILSAGCTGYIEKPIDPDSFLNDVEAFLTDSTSKPIDPK